MVILLWLFGFLTLLSLVFGSVRDRYCQHSISTKIFLDAESKQCVKRRQAMLSCFDALIATAPYQPALHAKKQKAREPGIAKPKRQKLYLAISPHTSRFNLAVFFKQGNRQYKEAAKRYLSVYLGSYVDRFIEELVEKGQWVRASSKTQDPHKVPLKTLVDLAKISFDRRDLVYQFLKSPASQECLFEPDRNKYYISVHYASLEVLEALLGSKELAQNIIDERQAVQNPETLKSNNKTLISYTFLMPEPLGVLFAAHGLKYDEFADVLDHASVHEPHRNDLPLDAMVPRDF